MKKKCLFWGLVIVRKSNIIKMKHCFIALGLLLFSTPAFSQDRFGVVIRCSGQADFVSRANCGSTFGVAGLGVMHAGIVDLSLGIGYSYKTCSHKESQITSVGFQEETFQIIHQMHFLNVPFGVSIQCWQQGRFCLKIHNELEYNRLCRNVAFKQGYRQMKTIETRGNIPKEAVNGLTYRLGLNATCNISEHCVLSLLPFFGVKAILNQYEPTPTHFPSEQHSLLPDHRFSGGVILGVEYCF